MLNSNHSCHSMDGLTEPCSILEKPIVISQETAESPEELASVKRIEELSASVCNYLIITASDDERKAILAKYSTYAKFFPKEHGVLFNSLNVFYCYNSEFTSLGFKNWLLALDKGFTEESYLNILGNGHSCNYPTCVEFLTEIKERYTCIFLLKIGERIKALSEAGNFDAAITLLHKVHYKLADSECANICKTEALSKLNERYIQDNLALELSNNLYVKSGITEFDNTFKGWRIGEISLGAGHTGVGKSWMMITLALKAAELGQKSLIISTEMSAQTVASRLFREAMQISDADYDHTDMVLDKAKVFSSKLLALDKITVIDGRSISANMIDSLIEQWKWENNDGKLVFVDYLQNIRDNELGKANTPTYVHILDTAKQLSFMAHRHNCAIVVLAQHIPLHNADSSDASEQGDYEMPMYNLSGLSKVVDDAAVVFLMSNITSEHQQVSSVTMRYGVEEKEQKGRLVKIDVVKTRYGYNGAASFVFWRTRGGGFASDKTPRIYWG